MGTEDIINAIKKNDLMELQKALDFFKNFTKKDYDLDQIVQKNGEKLLHIATKYGSETALLYLLLEPNVDINLTDNEGNTLAHYAVIYGQPKILEHLKNNGADFSKKNNYGCKIEQYISIKPQKEENKRIKKELEALILQETDKLQILTEVSNNRLLPLAIETIKSNPKQSRYEIPNTSDLEMLAKVATEKPEELNNNSLKRKSTQQKEIFLDKKLQVSKASFFKDSLQNKDQFEPLDLSINKPLDLSIKSCLVGHHWKW